MSEPPSFLEEARQLDLLEAVIRDRHSIEGQRLAALERILDQMPQVETQGGNALFDLAGSNMRLDWARQSRALKSMSYKLSELPISKKWNKFQQQLDTISELEKESKKAEEQAEKYLNPNQFWAKVSDAKCWLDVQLPEIDLDYRRVVSNLNAVKQTASNYYFREQNDLRTHHLNRFVAIRSLMIEFYPEREKSFLNAVSCIEPVGSGHGGMVSPGFGTSAALFPRTRYINFLDGGVEANPVFGSSLESPNGSRTLGKDILLPEPHASPLSDVFTPVNPTNSVIMCIKGAFSLETVWLQEDRHDLAIASVTRPGVAGHYVNKGWLLGFMLVNLPTPLIQLEPNSPNRAIPSHSIGSYFDRETEESSLFFKIWPHTDGANIRLGAAAITQTRNSEKAVESIRTTWNPDIRQPFPAHQRNISYSGPKHKNTY